MHASPFADLERPVAVVCHDAGAANIILSWLSAAGLDGCRIYLKGPAAQLWSLRLPVSALADTLKAALWGCETLISGTGWESDLEHRARLLARDRTINSIAVLDHWVNYAQRFERGGVTVLPDEIWVTDDYARARAEPLFPGVTLRQFDNPYTAGQLRQVAAVPPAETGDILYVLEPVRSSWGRDCEGEFQALDYFVDSLPNLGTPPGTAIRLRPHPSDAAGKYDRWIAAHPHLNVLLDRSSDMAEAIGTARWVAGCESSGLVLALAAGRTVFCTLPPWAPECRLPHTGLVHVKSLELQQ